MRWWDIALAICCTVSGLVCLGLYFATHFEPGWLSAALGNVILLHIACRDES